MSAAVAVRRRVQDQLPLALAALGLYVVAAGVMTGRHLPAVGLAVALWLTAVAIASPAISWRWPLAGILFIVFAIPIGEYFIPGNLPFQLEPYRIVVGIVILLWFASLLTDSRVRLKKTGFEGPLALIVIAVFGSVAVNPGRVGKLQAEVTKSIVFFAIFVLFFYFVATTVRGWREVDFVIKLLVGSVAVLGLLAMIEYRWGVSPFTSLNRILPLHKVPFPPETGRGAHVRARASAQHPIALGALMAMTLPLSIYLIQKYGKRWRIAPVLISLGAFASVSRTAVIMLVGCAIAIAWMRPRTVYNGLPSIFRALVVIAVVVKLLVPGAVGTLRYEFSPKGGIIANQSTSKGSLVSGGRLTDVGPVLSDVARHPFGIGFGTNLVGRDSSGKEIASGRILDDEWLGTTWQTGVAGALGWAWLLTRFLRRIGGVARRLDGPEGWLGVGLVAAVFSFLLGMFTYDAFAFIQVTFVLYLVLAIGAVVARLPRRSDGALAPSA